MQRPKVYEASWQIEMARNSEDTNALIERLRLQTTYSIAVQHSCGMPEGEVFGDYLGGKLKVELIKKVANVVEMKVGDTSLDQVKACAEAIVAMIVEQQQKLIDVKLAGQKELIPVMQQKLQRDMKLFADLKRNESGSLKYLAKLEYINALNTHLDALQEEVLMSQLYPAKLIAPIYVPDKPRSPKLGLWMLVGLTLGLFMGMFFAVVRDLWRNVA
jgi:predicted house-cleaning noncanonical NTP pyrophosphatase (MazG superfamily)